jgi:hypothetical protein
MKESWSAGPRQGRQSTRVPEREARSIPWSGAIKMIGLSVEGVPPRALCRSSPAARGCLGPSDDTIVCVLHATTSGLDTEMALNPVTFNWKDTTAGTTTQYGFIAQEVRNILPNLVSNTGLISSSTPDGLLRFDYNGLFAPIVKAVQEIATITGTFKTNLIAWLGHATNGITDLFA